MFIPSPVVTAVTGRVIQVMIYKHSKRLTAAPPKKKSHRNKASKQVNLIFVRINTGAKATLTFLLTPSNLA